MASAKLQNLLKGVANLTECTIQKDPTTTIPISQDRTAFQQKKECP